MWKNMEVPDTPQMKICVIRRTRIACWITKATGTHSEYCFSMAKIVCERISVLDHITFPVLLVVDFSPRKAGFNPRTVHVRSVLEKWLWDILFSEYFRCSLSMSFSQCYKFIIQSSTRRYVQFTNKIVVKWDTSPRCWAEQNFLSTGGDTRFVQRPSLHNVYNWTA